MSINSKRKGKNGELEFCNIMKDYGYKLRRSVQYCGKAEEGQADVVGLPYIHCEIKRVEKLNIDEAMEQALRDKKFGQKSAVFHRKNKTKWKVTMYLDDWIQIYRDFSKAERQRLLEKED